MLLAQSLVDGDHTSEALALLNDKAPKPSWDARRLVELAFIQYRHKDPEGARRLAEQAAAINPEDGREIAVDIEFVLGNIEFDNGNNTEAEACFRRALNLAPKDSLRESYALSNLGYFDLTLFRNDEATVWLQRSREVAERAGAKRGVEIADTNLGVAYHRLGDPDLALRYLDEAASVTHELGDQAYLAPSLVSEGETALDLGEYGRAKEYFEKARRLASPKKDGSWLATALVDLSMIALAKGDSEGAERLSRSAGEAANSLRDKAPQLSQRLQAAEIAAARKNYSAAEALYNDAMALARELRDPVGQWQCHAGLASIARATGRLAEAGGEYKLAIETIEDERSKLQHDDFKFSFLSHLIRFYDEYVDFLLERGDRRGAFLVSQSARGRVLAEKDGRARESSLDIDSLQRTLRSSNAILLSYSLAPARSLVWVLDGTAVQEISLPGEREISDRVRQYSEAISSGTNPVEISDRAGRWLFAKLIPPAYQSGDNLKVIIQPDGSLHQLNFESLPASDGHYWIESATVSIAPSLALLREAANVRQKRLLMFGDPEAASDLPQLRSLSAEMDSVGKHYREKQIYDAADATPAAYLKANVENYSTLHFASHAVANRESPLDSAIILAGTPESRKLYARDVLGHRLTAELVTLAACETAGNRAYYGEGLIGLSWAFLSAGARNVVAGLWKVDDRATAHLMKSFYNAMDSGSPPASALRQAKLELMGSSPVYQEPVYWAAFETFTRALYR